MKSNWSDCKNWRIHRKISTPKYNNWTFCSNFILKVHNNFPTSFQYFVFCSELLKLTSKSPQAHTVSIYFSQPVIESSWESHCKLSTFLQQVIDICRERHYNLSVFISCSKLLKVNGSLQYLFLTEKLLKVHNKSPEYKNVVQYININTLLEYF